MGLYYRKLRVWRKSMDLAKSVYQLVPRLPKEETYGIRIQITRAAASIPANIAEGWARESVKERAQFLAIAQGSLAETETYLTLCEEIGWLPEVQTATLRKHIEEVGKMLSTMRKNQRLAPKS